MKREPDATARQSAAALRNFFLALVDEGFTEPQALVILGQMLGAAKGTGDAT